VSFVIDASIAASWYFDDERDERADTALALLDEQIALAPLHWWFEIHNVVLLGERRKRGSEQHTFNFLAMLDQMSIELAGLPEYEIVLALARKHGLTFYDAAYLELAMGKKLPLATLDDALIRAARAEGIALI
jgi:predicted nucleic acid-binding protein